MPHTCTLGMRSAGSDRFSFDQPSFQMQTDTLRNNAKEIAEIVGWSRRSLLTVAFRFLAGEGEAERFLHFLRQEASLKRLAGKTVIEGTIDVPACWRDLVRTSFSDLDREVPDATGREEIADPKPYVDDHREVGARLQEGYEFVLQLASGKSHYWARHELYDRETDARVYQGISFQEFDPAGEERIEVEGVEFLVRYNWKGEF